MFLGFSLQKTFYYSHQLSLIFLSLVFVLLISSHVYADEYYINVTLKCSNDSALIQFERPSDSDLLSMYSSRSSELKRWSDIGAQHQKSCTLSNGNILFFEAGREQAFAYGAGGGNPPEWISVWINQKKIISKQAYHLGYTRSEPIIDISIEPDIIDVCRYSPRINTKSENKNLQSQNPFRISCESRQFNLSALASDPFKAQDTSKVGTISVAAVYDENFCRQFIHPAKLFVNKSYMEYFAIGTTITKAKEVLSLLNTNSVSLLDQKTGRKLKTIIGHDEVFWEYTDFNNDGRSDTVI